MSVESSEISLDAVLKALDEIMKDKVIDQSSNTSAETESVATNISDVNFFLKEANQSFQSMGSVFEWLGQKLADVKPTTKPESPAVSVKTDSVTESTLTASVAESYASMVQSYTTLIIEAKSTRDKETKDSVERKLKALNTELEKKDSANNTISISENLKEIIKSNNTTISSVNSTIQKSIYQLSEDEMDDFTRPSSLATSVKTQLSKKDFMEGLLEPLLRPKLQRIQVLMEDITQSISSSASPASPASTPAASTPAASPASIDSRPFHDMMNQLIIQKNGLLKTLMGQHGSSPSSSSSSSSLSTDTNNTTISKIFKDASSYLKPNESTDSSSLNESLSNASPEIKIKIRKNLRKVVAVAASMIIDVNNIFISIGQHIIGEDDTLGGAIFFKLDKDGTVLEQLHSAIFKDSNEYDKFVTLAGGDRNNLWTKNEGDQNDLIGKIQTDNIPPEVAKLRDAVRRTQKNTAAAIATAIATATTTATATATATATPGGGNNTTKKYYKRATRTKRPRRLGRRTR